MAKKKKKTVLSTVISMVIIAAVIWMKYQETTDANIREGKVRDKSVEITVPAEQSDTSLTNLLSVVQLSSTQFEVLKNCSLIDHRGNDGDSFHVKTAKGEEEVRLYFVDAPESAARTYGGGENNYERIAQQGAAMGGLDQKQTTQVGVEAKLFAKKLLKARPFTIVTKREKVYRSHRIYAYVIVEWEGEKRYLHELLVAHGLGRIHTKPMTMPDNTSGSRQRDRLKTIENYAKSKDYGAWGAH
ncbi:thermonuclease family protein [Verrucomicrobiaceae bacterium R5-34]|uniref:Thermonuclease family protein n=1 Tax=Oceaniferula flava TaxID=2800421 RepID=A0AAE2SAV0_9BACT|nr:thermonuclease family protein [Oceaniferula flavus]MBK1830609.1 thermonuclease family protein [Verrucomicrobiaceae bacterium R5-34]MBK1854705.1 thermonuclease family protein [Oceaniferula flavus]MBM1136011.1 thermonuclease family protein [Oceaniferula flavus]